MSTSSTRITRIVTGALLGTGLALAAPLAASAHIGVSPEEAPRGASSVLTFAFTHGCDHSPTTGLRFEMPEGLASVSPTADANWDIAIERRDNGLVSVVTYTAIAPIPDELRGAVSMAVRIAEDAPDTLAFPVVQTCADGTAEWTELAAEGQDPHDLDAPAPVLAVADGGSGHAAHGDRGSAHGTGEHASESDAAASVVPWILSGTALAVSLAALGTALRARRSRV